MTAFTDRLDAMVVAASAPGGGVHGELRGSQLSIYFSAGFYDRTDENDLARRLEQLARLLWAERTRYCRQAVQDAGGWPVSRPEDDDDRTFEEERERLTATGESPDGRITVSVRGMTTWTVTIAPGTLRSLDEAAFGRTAAIVADRLMSDQSRQILRLRGRVYGGPR